MSVFTVKSIKKGISKSVKLSRMKRWAREKNERWYDVSRGNFGVDATPKRKHDFPWMENM